MCRSTPKPKSIDGWSLPSAYHVIGGLGLAALLAVTPGWHEVTLHSHWTLSFTSAGARGGRLVARPAFLDDRAVITVAHAPADAAEAPTRLLLRRLGRVRGRRRRPGRRPRGHYGGQRHVGRGRGRLRERRAL